MQIWYQLRDDAEMMKRVALVHITSSGYGARIVFTADINEGNLADNQIVFAQKFGYQPDESCIDATRNSFAPKEEDILYINEELLFDYYDENFDKRFTPEYRQKRTQPLYHKDKRFTPEYRQKRTQPLYHKFPSEVEKCAGDCTLGSGPQAKSQATSLLGQTPANSQKIMWQGYDIQGIIDQRYAGKLPCAEDSNRHKESLKLATDLLIMLDGDKAKVQRIVEAQPWVQEIIDERDENVAQTVESAAGCVAEKEKKYASSLPSKSMLKAIEESTGKNYQEITSRSDLSRNEEGGMRNENTINAKLEEWGREIVGA